MSAGIDFRAFRLLIKLNYHRALHYRSIDVRSKNWSLWNCCSSYFGFIITVFTSIIFVLIPSVRLIMSKLCFFSSCIVHVFLLLNIWYSIDFNIIVDIIECFTTFSNVYRFSIFISCCCSIRHRQGPPCLSLLSGFLSFNLAGICLHLGCQYNTCFRNWIHTKSTAHFWCHFINPHNLSYPALYFPILFSIYRLRVFKNPFQSFLMIFCYLFKGNISKLRVIIHL